MEEEDRGIGGKGGAGGGEVGDGGEEVTRGKQSVGVVSITSVFIKAVHWITRSAAVGRVAGMCRVYMHIHTHTHTHTHTHRERFMHCEDMHKCIR